MFSTINVQIEAAEVLGISSDASLEQIRDAYRAKAKRHHPDIGGEDWAFRIVSQAYEILSTARVTRAADREASATAGAPRTSAPFAHANGQSPFQGHATTATGRTATGHRPFAETNESVRRGVQEKAVDPGQVVDVEKLTIRFQSEGIWLITDRSNEDRFLSCCLNVTWPSPANAPTQFRTRPLSIFFANLGWRSTLSTSTRRPRRRARRFTRITSAAG